MSAQGHATAADTDAAHHDHYEGIPADRAGPDEPRTPLWLPLIGISLLLVALLAFVMTRPAGKTGAELAKEASPEPSAAPAAPAAAATPGPAGENPRIRNLPPHVASALAEARGAAKRAANEEQGIAAPAGSAPATARPRPAPPGAPGAAPTPNPPHGAPGHVH